MRAGKAKVPPAAWSQSCLVRWWDICSELVQWELVEAGTGVGVKGTAEFVLFVGELFVQLLLWEY